MLRRASRISFRLDSAPPGPPSDWAGSTSFLVHKWYFDELYWAVFVRPCMAFARFCHQIDKILIDGLVDGSAAATALLSRLEGVFDMIAVDRLVNLTGKAVYTAGDWSRSIQTGRLRNYLMFLAVALVGPLRRSLRLDSRLGGRPESSRRPAWHLCSTGLTNRESNLLATDHRSRNHS